MYRMAARRLFCSARQYYGSGNVRLWFWHPQAEILPSLEEEHIANIPYSGECLIQGKSKAWVGISRAEGSKCERCWNYSQQVGSFLDHPTLCTHCNDVVTLHMHSQVAAVS
ncbi:hypothetical protein RJT34_23913 [Clitoria ternatea]|uniref:Zinc finger FPG/IleRS-type domain-containing protein n=1 Tax=Clitoria ternatea TaxID=43366 RepID=A0AAN9IHL0_CLITE